jgi:ABC-2 type transport system ATP-binding protein
MSDAILEAAGVSRAFGSRAAVCDVTLHLAPGASTACSAATGRARPRCSASWPGCSGRTRGRCGRSAWRARASGWRSGGASRYVPETPSFPPLLRVRTLAAFCASFYPAWDDALVTRTLQRFRIDPAARMHTLSQGARSRACAGRSRHPGRRSRR